MSGFGKPQKGPDDTEGYASITLTLKEPDCEIKTIACFIKNDLILQDLQRENQRDLYVKTNKDTKFFLYFFCSESNLSDRLVESEIVAHRYTKPTKDKICKIENKLETQPFFLRDNRHVFLPVCHDVFKTEDFEGFLTKHSSAVTIKGISAGQYRGVQNSNVLVKYFSFSLSSSINGTLNIPIPAYDVFHNLVDGPLLLFEEASKSSSLVGWYKNTPEKNRIIVYNLTAQDTTDICEEPKSYQTDGSQCLPVPFVSADPPVRNDKSDQSRSGTGAHNPNNVQGAPTNVVLEATTAEITIRCNIKVGGSDVVGTAMILDHYMGRFENLSLALANQRNVFARQGVDVSGVDSGSIIIHLRVKTIEALEELWQRYKNGDLRESLERVLITDEIRKLGKTIEMVVTMSEEQYQDARSFLGETTQHKEKCNPVGEDEPIMKLILDHEDKIKFLEDTTDIGKTSIDNQTGGSQPLPDPSGSADQHTSNHQSDQSGLTGSPTSTDQANQSGLTGPTTSTDQPKQSGSTGLPTSTNSQPNPNYQVTDFEKTINIAVSSRALFNLEEEHGVFKEQGLKNYNELQLRREDQILDPGAAFPFIKALQNVNAKLKEQDPNEKEIFTIALMSHNNAQVGIRLQNSIEHHGLIISQTALNDGESAVNYLKAYNIALFLTSHENEATDAIRKGFPAAVMSLQPMNTPSETQLRIAFGLNAVLISEDSDRIYQAESLGPFFEHEKENKDTLLKEGTFKPFAEAIGRMQKKFDRSSKESCPISTYIVTSRHPDVKQRVLLTLRSWGLEIDASHFRAGAPKDEVLKAINPQIFFDKQLSHVHRAREKGIPSGHVPSVTREYDE